MSATLEQSLQARTTATTEARATVWSRLFAPAASAPLVYFRIAFGAIMLWEVWRYFEYNWIYRYYIQPTFFFSYFPFDWLPPLPGDLMYLFFYGMALLAVLVMVGLYYRASMTLFFLGFTYWFLLDHTNYLNHFYLIALVSFIMIFLPAHRRLSLDTALKPSLRGDTIPAWALWLLRFQIGVAYFYGGIAKINPDWLQATPMNYWLAARTDFPLIGHLFTETWMHYFFSYGGLFFDLLVIPALLWRPTRNFALLVAVMFHLTNARLFNIGIFPWFMIAATLILFAPAWLTKHRLWRLGGAPANLPEFTPQPLTSAQRWTLALVGVFVVWQVLMPLRHWLYPGYVSWAEEGHNFSWHMKLRGKSGSLSLYVFDPDSYSTEAVNLRDHLTPRQIDKMSTRPHMMLQFAHYLADQQRAQGRDNFSIHARAWVSLNGRDWQLMIDPQVDLASQPRDIWHKTWVLPLTTPLFADEGARIIVGGD